MAMAGTPMKYFSANKLSKLNDEDYSNNTILVVEKRNV